MYGHLKIVPIPLSEYPLFVSVTIFVKRSSFASLTYFWIQLFIKFSRFKSPVFIVTAPPPINLALNRLLNSLPRYHIVRQLTFPILLYSPFLNSPPLSPT